MKRIHHAVSIMYMLVAVMLVFVNAIVSKIVYRQYRGDSKIGPVNAYSFSEFQHIANIHEIIQQI